MQNRRSAMWCAACSRPLAGAWPYCDQCGAALLVIQGGRGPARGRAAAGAAVQGVPPLRPAWRRWWPMAPASLAFALAVWAGGASWRERSAGEAPARALYEAMQGAVVAGGDPGREPICMANGLAYDLAPVRVQADDQPTVAWMGVLVDAGLYDPPHDRASVAVRTYQPRAELIEWAGAHRLCVARGVRVQRVENIGPVGPMRLHGLLRTGVAADVVWELDDPAPWLALPEVSAALLQEMPSWRRARWQQRPGERWQMVQRRHFFLVEGRWLSSDAVAVNARPDGRGKALLKSERPAPIPRALEPKKA